MPEAMLSRSPGAQRQGRPVSPAADMAELLDGVVGLVTFGPSGPLFRPKIFARVARIHTYT